IFFAHIAGIVAWTLGAKPGPTFLIIYVIIILYYIKRFFDKKEIVKTIKEFFPDTKFIATSPTIKQNEWRVAVSPTDRYYVATVVHGHIQLYDEFERVPVPIFTLMDQVEQDKSACAWRVFLVI